MGLGQPHEPNCGGLKNKLDYTTVFSARLTRRTSMPLYFLLPRPGRRCYPSVYRMLTLFLYVLSIPRYPESPFYSTIASSDSSAFVTELSSMPSVKVNAVASPETPRRRKNVQNMRDVGNAARLLQKIRVVCIHTRGKIYPIRTLQSREAVGSLIDGLTISFCLRQFSAATSEPAKAVV